MRWFFDAGVHPCAKGLDVSISATVAPVLWRYETSAVLAREQNRATRHLLAPMLSSGPV
jgi:hypothetical protein